MGVLVFLVFLVFLEKRNVGVQDSDLVVLIVQFHELALTYDKTWMSIFRQWLGRKQEEVSVISFYREEIVYCINTSSTNFASIVPREVRSKMQTFTFNFPS